MDISNEYHAYKNKVVYSATAMQELEEMRKDSKKYIADKLALIDSQKCEIDKLNYKAVLVDKELG